MQMAAMPKGGVLRLRTTHDGSRARLEVSDTGPGLTSNETHHLFTPYYTANHHGAGLGLAIVQSVVSDHGGRISVESEPGVGHVGSHILSRRILPKSAELLPADNRQHPVKPIKTA